MMPYTFIFKWRVGCKIYSLEILFGRKLLNSLGRVFDHVKNKINFMFMGFCIDLGWTLKAKLWWKKYAILSYFTFPKIFSQYSEFFNMFECTDKTRQLIGDRLCPVTINDHRPQIHEIQVIQCLFKIRSITDHSWIASVMNCW